VAIRRIVCRIATAFTVAGGLGLASAPIAAALPRLCGTLIGVVSSWYDQWQYSDDHYGTDDCGKLSHRSTGCESASPGTQFDNVCDVEHPDGSWVSLADVDQPTVPGHTLDRPPSSRGGVPTGHRCRAGHGWAAPTRRLL
jgi:hypothetical protein